MSFVGGHSLGCAESIIVAWQTTRVSGIPFCGRNLSTPPPTRLLVMAAVFDHSTLWRCGGLRVWKIWQCGCQSHSYNSQSADNDGNPAEIGD
jgi:hypothetical protein